MDRKLVLEGLRLIGLSASGTEPTAASTPPATTSGQRSLWRATRWSAVPPTARERVRCRRFAAPGTNNRRPARPQPMAAAARQQERPATIPGPADRQDPQRVVQHGELRYTPYPSSGEKKQGYLMSRATRNPFA